MRNLDENGRFISMIKTHMSAPQYVEKEAARRPRDGNSERRKRPRLSSDMVLDSRLNAMLERAAAKGLEFDLDEDWLREKLALEHCEVTGIRFEGAGTRAPFSRSIDRTDNNVGYTKANCKVVLWIYNQAKKNYGAEYVLQMARALVSLNP